MVQRRFAVRTTQLINGLVPVGWGTLRCLWEWSRRRCDRPPARWSRRAAQPPEWVDCGNHP